MPRFVVLFHQVPARQPRNDHWDLMLEDDGQLLTWALDREPASGTDLDAIQLAQHRIEYLEFQGELSGGTGADVRRVMSGTFEWAQRTDNEYNGRMAFDEGGKWDFSIKRLDQVDGDSRQLWDNSLCFVSPSGDSE